MEIATSLLVALIALTVGSGCGKTVVYVLRDNSCFPIATGTAIKAATGEYRTTAEPGYFMTSVYIEDVIAAKLKDPDLP